MKKRHFLAAATLAACGLCNPASAADVKFPTKPVQMIVPYPPGQGIDIIARILAEELAKEWKQAVYIDNKAGGASIPGMIAGRDAAPDGHVLTMTSVGAVAINPAVYPKLARFRSGTLLLDFEGHEVCVGLAAADEARFAVADEDDGGLERGVVVAGHGEAVGAGRGHRQ